MKDLLAKLKKFWNKGKVQKGIVVISVFFIIGIIANLGNTDADKTAKPNTKTEETNSNKEDKKEEVAPPKTDTPTAPKEEIPVTPKVETPVAPTITMGQKNALSKAHDYLNYSAFSYSGLIEQLEYEKFSKEDATYAVDNCGADWNKQAEKKAQDYINYSSFSRGSLIDQLVYEGFTQAQAEHGATAIGY